MIECVVISFKDMPRLLMLEYQLNKEAFYDASHSFVHLLSLICHPY